MTPPSSSTHTITIPTAQTITYTLRSLSSDSDDVTSWTKFCSSVFSYKDNPPPPSYFARHYYNDPRRDASLIRVLVFTNSEEKEEIVSSVRIFRRSLTLGESNSPDGIEAGGIGEVCTSPHHQRRGLSKILLSDALTIMKDKKYGMSCSLLHASPEFRPVYAKVGGYESVRSNWSVAGIRLNRLSSETSGPYESTCSGETVAWRVRRANFPYDASDLHRLHKLYSEARFITIARSEQYWNDYVSEELGDTLWVLTKETDAQEQIIGWMSIRKRGGRYQLREFGADKTDGFGTAAAVQHLLGVALHQAGEDRIESEVSLHLPTIVLSDIQEGGGDHSFMDLENAVEENDDGWMYVNFDESKPNVLEMTKRDDGKVGHLIWPTDSF
jgi:predicted GNAT family N-acyltransferase